MDAHSSQSFTRTSQGRRDGIICLSIDHAEEVIDALQWVIDDWDNMDADERETHQGYYDTYHSILKQLAVELDLSRYPEPEGCPSY